MLSFRLAYKCVYLTVNKAAMTTLLDYVTVTFGQT